MKTKISFVELFDNSEMKERISEPVLIHFNISLVILLN